ncbi:hypothetical protein DVK44_23500 [Streptomyces paludis]|uniref:Uncharacterized protein n=1 Tax=Streptomyces paludis TaxID=2282738 RepID=A0A345HTW5_9ACTN|nr:hypothetical protein DVK44_23500 [Streptomyces paludis]
MSSDRERPSEQAETTERSVILPTVMVPVLMKPVLMLITGIASSRRLGRPAGASRTYMDKYS